MSRAQWLALGPSLALASCTGPNASRSVQDSGVQLMPEAGTVVEAGAADGPAIEAGSVGDDAGLADGSVEAGLADGSLACPSRSGYFACDGGTDGSVCDRSVQACQQTVQGNISLGTCQSYAQYRFPDGGSCGTCPTCDCLNQWLQIVSSTCGCNEDDGGTVVFSCYGACYGSPPARLERIA